MGASLPEAARKARIDQIFPTSAIRLMMQHRFTTFAVRFLTGQGRDGRKSRLNSIERQIAGGAGAVVNGAATRRRVAAIRLGPLQNDKCIAHPGCLSRIVTSLPNGNPDDRLLPW